MGLKINWGVVGGCGLGLAHTNVSAKSETVGGGAGCPDVIW